MNRSAIGPSFPTEVAAASELAQAVGTAQNAATSKGDLPMAGFSASVHQYLNQLLIITYSKTTTLLAANMVLVSLLLSTRTSFKIGLDDFYIGAVCFFSLSAINSAFVLFPRFHHHDASGLIFWRAILANRDANKYHTCICEMTKERVEEEYAKDNYHVAKTIGFKDMLLRTAISLFIAGLSCAVIGVVLPMLILHH